MDRAVLPRHVKKHDVGRSQYRTEDFEYLFGTVSVTFRRTKAGAWAVVDSSALKAALGKSYALRALIEERRQELGAPTVLPTFTKRPILDAAPLSQLTPA
jgi:hypothetical protein